MIVVSHVTYAWHPDGLHIFSGTPVDPIILQLSAEQMLVLAKSASEAAARRIGSDSRRVRELEAEVKELRLQLGGHEDG